MESTDKQQVQLHQKQWSLIKEQMSGFQRDITMLHSFAATADVKLAEVRGSFDGVLQGMQKQFEQAIAALEHQAKTNMQEVHGKQADLQRGFEAMDVRVQSKCQILQEEIAKQSRSFDERLSKHDKYESTFQAALEKLDRDLRLDIGRLQTDLRASSVAMRDSEAGIKKEILRSKADQDAAHRKAMEELESKLRMENATFATKDLLQQRLSTLNIELHKEIERLGGQHDSHKGLLDQSKTDLQRSMSELERAFNKEQTFRVQATEAMAEVRGCFFDYRNETDKKLDSERQMRADLKAAFEALESGLKRDFGRVSSEQSSHVAELQVLVATLRGAFEKHVGSSRGEHEQVLQNLKDQERVFRKDLSALMDESQSTQARFPAMLDKLKVELRSLSQSGLEELDATTRRELQRLSSDHKVGNTKLYEMFDTFKSDVDRLLVVERASREDHKNGVQDNLSELERQIAKDVKRIGEEMQGSTVDIRDHKTTIESLLIGHKSTIDEHKASFLEELASHRESMDVRHTEHRSGLAALEQELRRELERSGDGQSGHIGRLQKLFEEVREENRLKLQTGLEQTDADLRALILNMREDHSSRHSAFQSALDSLDETLRKDFGGHKTESQSSLQRTVVEINGQFQRDFSEMESTMKRQFESFESLLQGEKRDRSGHYASLQGRVDLIETTLVKDDEELRERLRRQLQQPSSITRAEFDGEVHRIWQAMDSHSHVEEPKPKAKTTSVIEERIIVQQDPVQVRPVPATASMIMMQPQLQPVTVTSPRRLRALSPRAYQTPPVSVVNSFGMGPQRAASTSRIEVIKAPPVGSVRTPSSMRVKEIEAPPLGSVRIPSTGRG